MSLSATAQRYIEKIERLEALPGAAADAAWLVFKLPEGLPSPSIVMADDGEIVIEWAEGDKKAVIGLDGDGGFGYALYREGKFRAGDHDGVIGTALPIDLMTYLNDLKNTQTLGEQYDYTA